MRTLHLEAPLLSEEELKSLLGKSASSSQVKLLLEPDVLVERPDGSPLVALSRGEIASASMREAYPMMYDLRKVQSMNRGNYAGAGADGVKRKNPLRKSGVVSKTSETQPIRSAIVGFFDRYPRIPFCRESAYTTSHPEEWVRCLPFIQEVSGVFQRALPERYETQRKRADETHPAYVIPGTPFTTLTVNNTVAGAYHYDKGDYKQGFGVMAVFRFGEYKGAELVFPKWGVAADLQHGDVILFDSHEMHGNIPFRDGVGREGQDWIRISMVVYYREKMIDCKSPAEERERAKAMRGSL